MEGMKKTHTEHPDKNTTTTAEPTRSIDDEHPPARVAVRTARGADVAPAVAVAGPHHGAAPPDPPHCTQRLVLHAPRPLPYSHRQRRPHFTDVFSSRHHTQTHLHLVAGQPSEARCSYSGRKRGNKQTRPARSLPTRRAGKSAQAKPCPPFFLLHPPSHTTCKTSFGPAHYRPARGEQVSRFFFFFFFLNVSLPSRNLTRACVFESLVHKHTYIAFNRHALLTFGGMCIYARNSM